MKEKIITKLKHIEGKEHIHILYAVESGSRAWGFDSKNSDYDVRYIYSHPLKWYLSIENTRDTLEHPLDDELDFSGWDVRKTLKLFNKSNPPLNEWLISPTIYLENGTFVQQLRALIPQYYSPITALHHYLRMAQGNYRDYLQTDVVRIKKYFYVLRPVFACMWIEQYKKQPPMEFIKMVQTLPIDGSVKEAVEALYERKISGEEFDKEKRIDVINAFLEEKIHYFGQFVKRESMRERPKPDSAVLNELFYQIVTS